MTELMTTSPNNSYRNVVKVVRTLHEYNNFMTTIGKPWMVDVIGNLIRLTEKSLRERHAKSDYVLKLFDGKLVNVANGNNVIKTTNALGSSVDLPMYDKAIIVVSQSANPCWTRFVLAKEILHLYTGVHGSLDVSATIAVNDAVNSRNRTLVSEDDMLDAETFCYYAAIEFMIPWKFRNEILESRHIKHVSLYEIACRLRIPESIVIKFFSNGYEDLSRQVNESISFHSS